VDHAVDFQKETPKGRNIRFGVREHAMGAILNGIAHSGLVIPYGGTFLIFSDYMRPSIRLACLMGLPVIYVFTHDSVFLGEDGPTHQPIEQLATLRALPKLYVIRPADAKETAAAWQYALENYHKGPKGHPFALCLTRQKVPILKGTQGRTDQGGFSKGAYVVVNEKAKLALVLIGTGSEVSLCVEVAAELEKRHIGVRVLSMPCRELFDQQDAHYRDEILPPQIQKKMVVEAALPMGWESLVGKEGRVFGIERFGTCAPQKDLEKFFGFTKENLVQKALEYLRD
jgi:transketolase